MKNQRPLKNTFSAVCVVAILFATQMQALQWIPWVGGLINLTPAVIGAGATYKTRKDISGYRIENSYGKLASFLEQQNPPNKAAAEEIYSQSMFKYISFKEALAFEGSCFALKFGVCSIGIGLLGSLVAYYKSRGTENQQKKKTYQKAMRSMLSLAGIGCVATVVGAISLRLLNYNLRAANSMNRIDAWAVRHQAA